MSEEQVLRAWTHEERLAAARLCVFRRYPLMKSDLVREQEAKRWAQPGYDTMTDLSIDIQCALAQSEAERERLNRIIALFQEITEIDQAELARERELHQGLREVVKQYRTTSRAHGTLCSHFFNNGNEICSVCIKADALLEDKSKPVATTS